MLHVADSAPASDTAVRLYLAGDRAALQALRDGGSVTLTAFAAASHGGGAGPWAANSTDEEDEFAALMQAFEEGAAVVAVDVEEVDPGDTQSVTLDQVAALHVDLDGSGDLAWFATQELDQVVELLD